MQEYYAHIHKQCVPARTVLVALFFEYAQLSERSINKNNNRTANNIKVIDDPEGYNSWSLHR